MSEMCWICNASKKEQLCFEHVGASTPREFSSTPAAAAIVTWYLSQNRGDLITFIGDYDNPKELPYNLTFKEIESWPDKTDDVINALLNEGVLQDYGNRFEDEEEPNNIYIRDLRVN